jgi:small subunit ribosomal protein S6
MLYELFYIVPTSYTEKKMPEIQQKVREIIEKENGKIVYEENRGDRKLAYPIKKVQRGFYILVNFEAEPNKIKKIDENLKLLPEVLRFMILKIKSPFKKEGGLKKDEIKNLTEEIDKMLEE